MHSALCNVSSYHTVGFCQPYADPHGYEAENVSEEYLILTQTCHTQALLPLTQISTWNFESESHNFRDGIRLVKFSDEELVIEAVILSYCK